uniref:Signal recognition particle 9 kDa protein n=1 Tax=Haptolina brevifila TaxID=156173 RepID=A0A7S2INI4_9EUKA|mmetsp:Transcript_69012/g.136795  ORF Transcript_69012/g.136795 Transcript_69012/m.136795 type:complete len:116 (+) Transcript_69012:139-486(+)|eukprot:CAMPEP_0174723906 /NCGR_PEP_ID=MMETSP1094-20130205/42188_1 /TAXON_ID=156173 /ORGANISM="Chrysochromulina brevifilum, Strain UTEX LB 985" /LENGTH=115 /DNA_ID=CAMNT_0015925031 /DNA_START=136 /DNA_END=483 /DNA_ORIENTATION=+
MVWIDSWDTFYAEAEKLYTDHPEHTRYVMKYRHCDGKLELKVTNDRVCLKFLTDQAQDLKRIEKLNNLFLTYMCGKDPQLEPPEEVLAMRADRPTSSEDPDRSQQHSGKKKKVKR